MDVVDVDAILDGAEAKFVGRSYDVPVTNAATGQPGGEAVGVALSCCFFSTFPTSRQALISVTTTLPGRTHCISCLQK